ncbi:ninjurin-A isoform X1 [Stomoxys calcitrans]|uniref:ninjurin-A isoform X1 n=1 Tax=Stomoxys calcitrans TaxID=35570 RepID=UPI0027E25CA8|nr:ninjurin-A isoform X1 [Stomoxys calcitrans]XP_013115775.2 ninjurin-A isoform X1 [Stomoxys calcitrans]XP_013115776.2 ninjurin-A isoform X1 [Stomoxys calcitrans]XP_013115777.2 ninjurin-A isoform X1 [Stomoxys calcitrans]XP_013115778.2 ninjurin-A isoform X1 [Stomoxys calcitrans]XP_013115779.2 ninjurin-A isoform X1 [Stomoxys calcitrans]
MAIQPHTTLEMNDTKSSHEVASPTDTNIDPHATHPFSLDDIDFIDGRVPRIPKSISEADEDEYDDRPFAVGPRMGVDDGLLPNGGVPDVEEHIPPKPSRRPSFSFPGYNGPGVVTINGVETPIPDVNAYQHKKTLAQGMMDLALLSANANQLRYVLESYGRHPYYYPSLIFISISIIFQIAVGVGLIMNSRYNIKNEKDICHANKVNNYTVIGIFIVTVVNVFISSFGVAEPAQQNTQN